MIPRVTTVEAAAEPPVVPPVAPVEPELADPFCAPEVFDAAEPPPLEAAPDVLSPEGAAGLTSIGAISSCRCRCYARSLSFSSS